MSLINQVLKDLDARRGPATGVQVAALQGMGLLATNQLQWKWRPAPALWVAAAVLLGIAAYQLSRAELASVAQRTSDHPVTEQTQLLPPPARVADPEEDKADAQAPAVTNEVAPVQTRTDSEQVLAVPAAPAPQVKPLKVAVKKAVKTLTPRQQAARLFERAQQALAAQEPTRAEALLRQTLATDAGHVEARSQLAGLLVARQESAVAEQVLAEGLLDSPDQLDLAKPYAQLLVARNALEPALAALNRAIAANGVDAEALALRAGLLYRQSSHAEAAADYRQALSYQPMQAVWWTGLAVAEEHNGQTARALAAYQRAAQLPLEQAVREYVNARIQALQHGDR